MLLDFQKYLCFPSLRFQQIATTSREIFRP